MDTELSSEEFIKLFDFATNNEFLPNDELESLSDEDILKELFSND